MVERARAACNDFPLPPLLSIEPLGHGRIHHTYVVTTEGKKYVLQHIAPVFVPTAPDIDAISSFLDWNGILTPRLVRTHEGSLTSADTVGAWRLMTYIPGSTIEHTPSNAHLESAAAHIASFHQSLCAFEYTFLYTIPHYRDNTWTLSHMRAVDAAHTHSVKYATCHPIVVEIEKRAARLVPELRELPNRIGHGDLKLNNIRFDEEVVHARALIDLDTVGRYPLPLELGDFLRSVCRTRENTIDMSLWKAAASAYRAHAPFLTPDEWRLIPDGFYEIVLSLAARYLADAYEETWFKHDPAYPSLYEQNIARAHMQLLLLDDFKRSENTLRILHV